MPKPQFTMNPTDFISNMELASCSIAAVGLWTMLVMRMANSPIYGKLCTVAEGEEPKAIIGERLYRLLGRDENEVKPLLKELLDCGAISRCKDTGAYMSRVMFRKHKISEVRRLSGSKGGLKTTEKRKELQAATPTPVIQMPAVRPRKSRRSKPAMIEPPELILVKAYWEQATCGPDEVRKDWTPEAAKHFAEQWYDSMKSKGWVTGKSNAKIKDWRAAARTGIRNCEAWGTLMKFLNQSTYRTDGHKPIDTKVSPV
jgi:hypothetical protein